MPAPGGQGGGAPNQSPTDNHMAAIWIIVAIFVFGYCIWVFFKAALVQAFFYVKLAEIWVFNLFTNGLMATGDKIHALMPYAGVVHFKLVEEVAVKVGHYLLIPVLLILAIFAVLLYFRSSTSKYRRTYDMNSFLKCESVLWPQTTPIVGKNLVDQHVEKGAWAMSLTPMQFAKRFKLIKENAPVVEEGKLNKSAKITVSVIKDKAAQSFAMQIGPLWGGFNQLNIHTKALFAAFLARAAGDEKASRGLLHGIAASSASGKLNFAGTNELLNKYKGNKLFKKILQKHAYVSTILISTLILARTDGVLASADFLWLKPIDRRLWFILNSVGRQTSPAEVAGPFAHWRAEKELERPVRTAMVQEAVVGLEAALKEIVYHPDEEEKTE